ncbi:MAG: hypothetical protein ACE5G0_22530, partial [Rhodothermales bacterium]
MSRSGQCYRKIIFPYVLFVFALVQTTQAQPAAAQDNGCPDQQEVMTRYSLYWENFKNENFEEALPDLRWILDNCPGYPRDKDQNFDRAIKAYDALANKAGDAATKRAYLDSALVIFDRAIPELKAVGAQVDECDWHRDKGRFIQKYLDVLEDQKAEAIEAYRRAYDCNPQGLDAYYLDVLLSNYYT